MNLYAGHRPWSWYLPNAHWFDPTPPVGIAGDVLRDLGERCGARRLLVYGCGGAPWLAFQLPHVHRHNIWNMTTAAHARATAAARAAGWEMAPLRIGEPYAL
jgi:hypothetical protein